MKTSPFLDKNLRGLAGRNNPAIHWLKGQKLDPAKVLERVFVNSKGLVDWRMRSGQGMFEALPPMVYYQGWNADPQKAKASATLIVGCNLGYGLNHVLVNTPNSHKVMVLEPDPEVLLACLGQTDYTPFLEHNKLIFLSPDKEVVTRAVRMADVQFLFGKIHLRIDTPSRQMNGEYARWSGICQALLENFSIEMTTLRLRQDTMVGNELGNFKRAMADGSVNGLKDSAKGLSALILGAGPSLAEIGPKLIGKTDNLLLATALQTLPALQQIGIKPHICMAIDFSDGMKKVFDRLDPEWSRDIPLIYSTKLNPEVVRAYPGPTIPVWTLGGLATFVFKDKEYVLDAGGNVSVSLLRFLDWCGAKEIFLAGQDFAWKGNSTHAGGHHAASRRADNTNQKTMRLKNRDGQTIYSTLSYVSALRDMERDISRSSMQVFNLYGGGAVIAGTEEIAPDRLDKDFSFAPGPLSSFLSAIERARFARTPPRFVARAAKWSSSLRTAQKRLEKLFKKPGKERKTILEVMARAHAFLRQDPLYLPYLYNETMDMAGLVHAHRDYQMKDLVKIKNIFRRVLAKVRQMDQALAPDANDKNRRAA